MVIVGTSRKIQKTLTMISENKEDLETEPLMVDVSTGPSQGEQTLDRDTKLSTAGKDVLSPVDASFEVATLTNNKVSSTNWFKTCGLLWMSLMVGFTLTAIIMHTVMVTVWLAMFLAFMAYVPVSLWYLFLLYSRLDRNQYPRFTELAVWKLIDNDKICYAVLGFCFFTSFLDYLSFYDYYKNPLGVFFAVCILCKGAVLTLFASRKAHLLLMRWKTMREGQSKNLELGKVALVVFPAVFDWVHLTHAGSFRYRQFISYTGVVINVMLILSFLAAVVDFFFWSRTQNMKEVYSQHTVETPEVLKKVTNSNLVHRGRHALASTLSAVATAVSPTSPTVTEGGEMVPLTTPGQSHAA